MTVDAAAPGSWVIRGLVCGTVTAVALGMVFAGLGEYQVMDYADQDFSIGLFGSLAGGIGAAMVIAGIRVLPGAGRAWSPAHVVVPLVLLPVVVLPLVAGLERDNAGAALIWGTAAIMTHVLVEASATSNGKRWAVAGLALVLAVAVLFTWVCQHRWRAGKFEAVGLPLYVPQVPGHHLSGTWAGRYTVSMSLRDDGTGLQYVDAIISRPDGAYGRCGPGFPERRVIEREGLPAGLGICLPGAEGAMMVIKPGYRSPDLSPLFDRMTVGRVDASVMADHPDGGETEPD
ncbi:hypothetical protein [Actinoplanes sp. M2I2]|uniref:hypothetical protein n=1 Tax=Actinoplanes sp. M2I2 TaxID=1734444 RepID=UPI0020206C58|nr:hypothetical protein [Actinoplanes sp. M2I2]